MNIRSVIAASLIFSLAGCISIATHEEQMRRCRSVGLHADELEGRVGELESQLAAKTAESQALEQNVAELKSTQDELQEKLKSDISQGDVAVGTSEGNLTITLGDKVLFRSGEWELQPRGQKVLLQVCDVLKKVDDRLFQVEGNTDNVPISGALKSRFPSNWDLSSARAAAVVRFLEKNGVDAQRLVLTAYGDRRPVGDNKTMEGRKLNRRVEISLEPLPAEARK